MYGSLKSGAALLAAGLIDQFMFSMMPRDSKNTGKRAKSRSKYTPHQSEREINRRHNRIQLGQLKPTV